MANNSNIQFLNSRTKRAEDELQKTMLRIHVISFHYQTKVRLSKSSNPLSRYDQRVSKLPAPVYRSGGAVAARGRNAGVQHV